MVRRARPIALALMAAVAALSVTTIVLVAVASARDLPPGQGGLDTAVWALAVLPPAGVGLLVVRRRPAGRLGWILLLGPLAVALVICAGAVALLALEGDRASTLGAWALWIAAQWPVLFVWPLALALSFPDSRLPSPRWRPLVSLATGASVGVMALLAGAPELDGPYGTVASPLPLTLDEEVFLAPFWACWLGLLASLLGAAALLRARYRTGSPEERRQILWLAYGAVLMPLWLGGGTLWSRLVTPLDAVVDAVALLGFQVWPAVAVAVAVTRHGLYSIDRLFTRTLVYAVLTALLAATYVLVGLAAGLLAGSSALSASLATLAAALAFRPLRDRIQHVVDRRFARARFEAVRLVRGFLDDVREGRAEPEDVGAVLLVALEDPSAEVLFRLPETGGYADRHGRVLDALPDDGRARSAIRLHDREVGILLHAPAPPCGPDALRAVLEAAAVPVELARLRVELRLQLAEVDASRARIARAGYEERRRIERDLHDGAQQRLVTLGIVLRRMQRSLPREARLLGPSLDAAVDEIAAAIADLRTIAAGVRPPRLDQGLSAALADLARGAGVPVEVVASQDRAPPDVEAAAYFVASEALTNALKHGSPSCVRMRAAREDGALTLEVADDGVGGAAPSSGTGLSGMLDRVAAQGGTLTLDSPPGAGTRLAVRFPCAS